MRNRSLEQRIEALEQFLAVPEVTKRPENERVRQALYWIGSMRLGVGFIEDEIVAKGSEMLASLDLQLTEAAAPDPGSDEQTGG